MAITLTDDEMRAYYTERYEAEKAAGGSITVNRSIPYVAIQLSDGTEYYFQEEEADNLLSEVPDWINAEVYLLASAQDW